MDKNAIKKYAVWARRELIARVSQKALQYGITLKDCGDMNADSINGTLLTSAEKKQRQALIARIKEKSYAQVMEEVAYTWFNRFSALRFMEVNGYLPTHVRVFTDEDNKFKPQIITEAIHLELDGLNMEKVYALKEENKTDELYKYLLITQCNALSGILPGMFQKIEDYTELLFPDNLLRDGSAIQQMIELIPEEDWKNAVQIIGWLYQYYNSEKKDDVFAALKKNVKITKENIPAATQLFTPDWIVRYMVENSLGRLWIEGHPNDELKAKWKYYLNEAKQEPEVEEQLAKIRKEYKELNPEDIKCIDPCCGSGHILAYLFDVLIQIYEKYGYTIREAVVSIIENNIFGLDIDDRAAQLANFSIMMKARQHDRRFFSHAVQPNIYAIVESNHIDNFTIEYFANGDIKLENAIKTVVEEMYDAKEYGSILTITPQDWAALYARFEEIGQEISIYREVIFNELLPVVKVAQALAQKYDVVTTNPPYMGNNGMGEKLTKYVKRVYPDTKSDLSTVCMEKTLKMCNKSGFISMINIPVWMFLSSYEKLRKNILENNTIFNMVHTGRGIFGSDFGTTSFVIAKRYIKRYKGNYRRLFDKQGEVESVEVRKQRFFEGRGKFVSIQDNFSKIPGSPIAYWVSEAVYHNFAHNKNLAHYLDVRSGISTGKNDLFYRFWYECFYNRISFNPSFTPSNSRYKWFPTIRGGDYRKWYGNMDNVLNLEHNAYQIKNSGNNYRLRTPLYYNKVGITWNRISASVVGFRLKTEIVNFGENSPCMFAKSTSLLCALGYLNSKIAINFLLMLNPTLTYQVIDIQNLPYINVKNEKIEKYVKDNINIQKDDWDSFETSWDFSCHPLISAIAKNRLLFNDISNIDLAQCFIAWENECNERFNQLKANEEELNRIFIDIYGLQDELTPEVEEKDVTVHKADLQRDIKSLISYAVGCMLGRYSLHNNGILYAGGAGGDFGSLVEKIQDSLKAQGLNIFPENEFYPDKDNIIPICDDEYFTDDIASKFVKFIEIVYGKETLDSNLKFIADALGGKGQPIDVIRNYFINNFYADHCKIYQKRPIYWLFDSGKKGGFKALIYMHRYQQDTIARMRTDYVHEQQGRYRTEISDLETRIAGASASERVKLNKRLSALQDKAAEIRQYEEKIHHLADQMIRIDLDDGVKNNYAIFQDVLAKIK